MPLFVWKQSKQNREDPFGSPRSLFGILDEKTLRSSPLCSEAFATENRLATFLHRTWFEGDLAGSTALRAYRVVHLPRSIVTLRSARIAAILAALRGT